MSFLHFCALIVVGLLLSMQGQKALRFHQKYINLCSEDERRSCWFGMTWGWVINDRIYIFRWTIPLSTLPTFLLLNPSACLPLGLTLYLHYINAFFCPFFMIQMYSLVIDSMAQIHYNASKLLKNCIKWGGQRSTWNGFHFSYFGFFYSPPPMWTCTGWTSNGHWLCMCVCPAGAQAGSGGW